MGKPERTENLTREKLFNFYRPPGIDVPDEEWEGLLKNSSWTKHSGVVVHVVLTDDRRKRFAFVTNAADRNREGKLSGIGIPTKEMTNGNTPLEMAKMALRDELNMSYFRISDRPLLIRKNGRKVTHIVFTGTADFPEEERIIRDPHKEVWQALFINPFKSIKVDSKGNGKRMYTTVLGSGEEKRYVFKGHLGMISFFLKSVRTVNTNPPT